jgi:hypothetical protein
MAARPDTVTCPGGTATLVPLAGESMEMLMVWPDDVWPEPGFTAPATDAHSATAAQTAPAKATVRLFPPFVLPTPTRGRG